MTPSYDHYHPVRRVPVMAANMVATSQPLATQAGLDMLQRGGNAADAAVAAAITLTVVEPTGNGLGSDAFAIVHDGTIHGLNGSGRSPAAWTPERFAGRTEMPFRGWDSVTVPGAVSAWRALSDRHGALDFATLFEPAIRYAKDGFLLTPTVGALWQLGAAALRDQPGFADAFMPGGRAPAIGTLVRNPAIAVSLREIADTGGDSFYRGRLAACIEQAAASHGAVLSLSDLAAHAADWCGTLTMEFAGCAVHELPPNGQGIVALQALGMLTHTAIASQDPDSPLAIHLQIEAVKLALADAERHVGDPAHMRTSPTSLLDHGYLAQRAALIDPAHASDPGAGAPRHGGTVYVTAADAGGMMVSFIQSNFAGFGSGCVVPNTGIHLQNRGAGFTLEPGHPNQVGPAKRPFHTIIPAFATRGGLPWMSFGVMGGPMQAQGHVQMMVRTASAGQNPQQASDAPRWRFVRGRHVAMEAAVPEATIEALRSRGHVVSIEPPDEAFGFGGAQLIQRISGGYVAGSDHRKDGQAAGF